MHTVFNKRALLGMDPHDLMRHLDCDAFVEIASWTEGFRSQLMKYLEDRVLADPGVQITAEVVSADAKRVMREMLESTP